MSLLDHGSDSRLTIACDNGLRKQVITASTKGRRPRCVWTNPCPTVSMRIREPLCIVLLVSLVLAPARAQTRAVSLEAAEHAFADTLLNHDRAAFMATFSPDAECSLPTKKHGPEDIANAWLPFLIDPNTTMVLTSTKAVVDQAGEVGSTTGTFAIRGRTSSTTLSLHEFQTRIRK
jgi:ketosteroid isomerase-like protein